MELKGILFDLDDTLIDSGTAITAHHIKIAKLLDRRVPTEKEIYTLLGMPWDNVLNTLWTDQDNEKFKKVYLSIPKENQLGLIPGINETLQSLHKKYKLGIITGRHQESTMKLLTNYNLLTLFSTIKTGTDKITKPNPDVFDFALANLDINKKEIIFIGDSMIDAKCAMSANVKFIAVETGYYKKEDFIKLGINKVLKNVNELPKYLLM